MRRLRYVLFVGLMAGVLMAPERALAEAFMDLYLGGAITQKTDVDVGLEGASGSLTLEDVDFQNSVLLGGRVGYWWDWFGLGLDVAYWGAEPDGMFSALVVDPTFGLVSVGLEATDQDVFMIALPLMARTRLVPDKQMPKGRLHLHGFLGPALFISTLETQTTVDFISLGVLAQVTEEDTATSFGLTAGAGVTWMLSPAIGIFGEYRLTYFSPEYEMSETGLTFDADLLTHQLVAGVTFRF